MINTRWIITFDLETDGKDPNSCNIVQLAAVPIHPRTLEIRKDESFNLNIKPPGIDKEEYFTEDRMDCIANFHAKNYKCSAEDIIEKWKQGVAEKTALKQFSSYLKKYKVAKKPGQWFPAPIPGGINITDFDIVILKRLYDKHKLAYPFSTVNKMDILHELFWWWENLEEPFDYKMDTIRKFLDMPSHGTAHDALVDAIEESEIIVRFMKFHRKQSTVAKFKGSFSKG